LSAIFMIHFYISYALTIKMIFRPQTTYSVLHRHLNKPFVHMISLQLCSVYRYIHRQKIHSYFLAKASIHIAFAHSH